MFFYDIVDGINNVCRFNVLKEEDVVVLISRHGFFYHFRKRDSDCYYGHVCYFNKRN